tara:strand:+ start:12134 stop:13564 length:1431 start_codon:yes stop_codon:yes gene_type:complete
MTTDVLVPFVDNVIAQDADVATFVSSGTVGELYAYDTDTNLNAGDTSAIVSPNVPRSITWCVKYTDEDGNTALKKSSPIPTKCIRSVRYEVGGAGTAKVVTIDSVDNIDCETEYCLKVRYESPEIAKTYGYQDMVKTYSYVTRCCGSACGCPDGAAWDALMGLAEQLNNDNDSGMNNGTAKSITHARVLNSTSPTASNDPDEIWTLTKGSNIINCATDIDYASGTDVAVGDFIRIMDGGGTVTTAAGDTFRVEATDTTALTITLDRPWPYSTQNLDTTGDAEVIPKATGEAFADSTWSMEIAGAGQVNPSGGNNVNYTPAYMTDFYVGLSCNLDCNATVTTSTALVQPEGYGVGIQQMEIANSRMHKPYMGATITDQPKSGYDYFVGTGTTQTTAYFNQLIVEYTDCGHESAEQPIISRKKLIIAMDAGDTTLRGAAAADASGETDDDVVTWWASLCDSLEINFEMEHIDLDAGTD